MDAETRGLHQETRTMTIAQKSAIRKRQIEGLRDEIREILGQKGTPLDLPTIEFYLREARIKSGEPIEDLDTFAVRDAVSELIDTRVARFTVGSAVELIRL